MYVYLGSLASDLLMLGTPHQPTDSEPHMVKWIMWVVGFVATIAVTGYVTQVAKKALNQSFAKKRNQP